MDGIINESSSVLNVSTYYIRSIFDLSACKLNFAIPFIQNLQLRDKKIAAIWDLFHFRHVCPRCNRDYRTDHV